MIALPNPTDQPAAPAGRPTMGNLALSTVTLTFALLAMPVVAHSQQAGTPSPAYRGTDSGERKGGGHRADTIAKGFDRGCSGSALSGAAAPCASATLALALARFFFLTA